MDSTHEDTGAKSKVFSRKSLYEIFKESRKRKLSDKFEYLETRLVNDTKCPEDNQPDLRHALSRFKSEFKLRWASARNTEAKFLKKNKDWLEGSITVPIFRQALKPGRPIKCFQEGSERTKRRKTRQLRRERCPEELSYAAQINLRQGGQVAAAKVIKDVTTSTPTRAQKYRNALKRKNEIKQLSPTEALSIFIEADLSRRQYNVIRQADKARFPSYSILQRAKTDCYPPRESYKITPTCAELELQPLLDHTAERLCMDLSEVLKLLTNREKENLRLISKWGCDGSVQTQFKQNFESNSESDANIFQSSFVYLRLETEIDGQKKTVWQNPTTSSPRYCRPIRIRFIHETTDVTNAEVKYIESKINSLQKSVIHTASGMVNVEHKLLFTMVDGKVCNAVTDTKYTQKCYICGATSRQFNNLDTISTMQVKEENLRFGLSILHARIRFFESILHLAYKLTIKQWQVKKKTKEEKIVGERKKMIQQAFKEEMGLLVDFPKAGFGNTNDGNTSRRFFSNIEKAAEITGVDIRLLHK